MKLRQHELIFIFKITHIHIRNVRRRKTHRMITIIIITVSITLEKEFAM